VEVARERYSFGPYAIEVIVADNASTDRTAEIAAARGCRVVAVAKRAIAAARNGGAAQAVSPILAFVDADTQIHPDTFNVIERALANERIVGGATGVTLERWSLGLAASYLMIVPIVLLTGMDTGVVFCRRSDFLEVGGYDERRRVAEDVAFLWALKRLGWSRRQRLTRLRSVKAIASTRKFDRHGDWHYFREMARLVITRPWKANATEELIRKYWYDDRV
jgi:glycosyltransferase involved in cell wall biosynthesis